MLEDFTMEKKSGRSGQPQVKGNGTESKKNQDSLGTKAFPKTPRRREPVSSQGPRHDTNRKPAPQKSKSFDKRPRPRGQYYGSGKEDTKVAEDEDVEYGSVLMPGSKKQNLNHLLNFHYAPRDGAYPNSRNWRASSGGRGRSNSAKWLMATHKHKYNKEQFLQANCQFVVKADEDYSLYMSNPDMLVEWDFIEQIRLRSAEFLSCPICLYPPVAAKMTRCGHVFCWSCILHYLALSDKPWRKCPICYESVHKQDLRSVIALQHNQFSVGQDITLRLMKRKRGSLVALPVEQNGIHSIDKPLSMSETAVDTKYAKLLVASSKEVASIIDQEKCDLEAQLAEEKGCPEVCFIEQALELLKIRATGYVREGTSEFPPPSDFQEDSSNIDGTPVMTNVNTFKDHSAVWENTPVVTDRGDTEADYLPPDAVMAELEDTFDEESLHEVGAEVASRQRYESVSSEGLGSEDGGTVTVEDIETSVDHPSVHGGAPLKDFYFYQAADGQHIYLHAINARMLEHFYGCLQNCPPTLTGRIVEKESGSMTEELRQRLRYLQHLPVTCQFEVAEILLKPPIVSKDTLDVFQEQLEIRKRRRQRRARDERRREKRIIEEENRRWGKFPAPHICINSHRQFPSYGVEVENAGSSVPASTTSSIASSPARSYEDFVPLTYAMETLDVEGTMIEPAVPTVSSGSPSAYSGPSFAQMLREGKSKGVAWPSVQRSKEQSAKKEVRRKPHGGSDSEPEPEGYVPVRSFKESFGDAIADAMERAAAAAGKDDELNVGASSGKKKKKQKQKILFATGMACVTK